MCKLSPFIFDVCGVSSAAAVFLKSHFAIGGCLSCRLAYCRWFCVVCAPSLAIPGSDACVVVMLFVLFLLCAVAIFGVPHLFGFFSIMLLFVWFAASDFSFKDVLAVCFHAV